METRTVGHTPGPWRTGTHHACAVVVEDFGFDGEQWKAEGVLAIEGLVAVCGANVDRSPTANARLIAAAPDLLAACKVARHLLEGAYAPDSPRDLAVRQLKAALAKAEPEGRRHA